MSDDTAKINLDEDDCLELITILNKKREYEKQLQCALSITSLAIWSWDLKSNFISLSDEIFDLLGHSKDEFDNSLEYIIQNIIHPDSLLDFKSALEMDLKNAIIHTRFFRLRSSINEECWIKINGELIFDDNGNQVKVLGTLLDVTDDHIIKRNLETNLTFLQSLVDTLPNPIFYKDDIGLYRYCNIAFLDYLGLKRNDVINRSVYHIAPKELADIYHKADLDLMKQKGHQVYEANVKYADGNLRDVLFTKATHINEYGEVRGLVGIMHDITEQNSMKHQVEMLHEVKDILLEINHSIMTYNNELEFIKVLLTKFQHVFKHCSQSAVLNFDSPSSLSVLQIDKESNEDIRLKLKLNDDTIAYNKTFSIDQAHIINNVQDYMDKHLMKFGNSTSLSSLAIPIKIKDDLKWILTFASNENNVYTKNDLVVANYIREEIPIIFNVFNLYQKTLILSRHDPLTNLMNRGYFDTVVADRLAVASRMNQNLVIALFDLDKLKVVNDKFGHNSGDDYITNFTNLLQQHFRKSDAFARIGGDEFVGIFANTDLEMVTSKINDLRQAFESLKFELFGDSFDGSFSFGLSNYPNDSRNISELLKISDDNMYKDKQRYK